MHWTWFSAATARSGRSTRRPEQGRQARATARRAAILAFCLAPLLATGAAAGSAEENRLRGTIEARAIPLDEPPPSREAPEDGLAAASAIQRITTPAPALRIGVVPRGPAAKALAALQPVRQGLERAIGRPVEILPFASYSALVDAQAERRVEVAMLSAAAFADLQARCGCAEPVAAPAAEDGGIAYYGVLIVRSDAGKTRLEDLRGARLIAGPADSIGARRLQFAALAAEGIDPASFFGAIGTVASPVEALRQVLAGKADAALGWSSMEGEAAAGYSRGTLAMLAAADPAAPSGLSVIWRTPALAHGPVAALSTLPDRDKRALASYLVGLADADPAAYHALEPLYPGGYRMVGPADYRGAELLSGGARGGSGPVPSDQRS
ncbi:phosphate/phosphite/phosphonate ABC transporter substrate-binding protein [Propylenella binzhouense]|uniref:Phosphate/phosphite/phosphonate ABC transporter substrate-binding protein n=1 Tax=Propylenella binzhouense TaxID=2555902 RepID=A0A964WUB6_9HYPH|nr:PhnD/SsuA/transferrin family substrate-binding protein [Propylenella binzhouense]MYZ48680.1 phosphate/phosphite/phosphonate ABC transporter substrate-binding protein [Propylenella binzhouense]